MNENWNFVYANEFFYVKMRISITAASHCQDLYTISSDDTEEMLAVKFRIRSMVKEWLNL